MNTCGRWAAVLIVALLPPNYSLGAEPATEAYQNGVSRLEKQQYDAAIAAFSEAIRLNPKYAVAYCNRGNAYGRKGENDEAVADYTTAIRLNPKDAIAYNKRGICFENKGEHEKAIADFTDSIQL